MFEASNAVGYQIGNRNRAVSIAILEWIMVHISIIIYYHLFSVFNPPFTIFKFGSRAGTLAGSNHGHIRVGLVSFCGRRLFDCSISDLFTYGFL